MEEVIKDMLSEGEQKWREKSVSEGGFHVAIDRWSSQGFNTEEATVTCICLNTNKVLYHCNIMRIQEHQHYGMK